MDLRSLFEWLEGTWPSQFISQSTVIFPCVESIHLVALAMLGGSVLVLDLRLLGIGLIAQKPSVVEGDTRRWLIVSVCLMVLTGALLFLAEPTKLYDSGAFTVKMVGLAAALLFTFIVRNRFARRDPPAGVSSKALALVSIGLWSLVAGAGRWIGWA
jgi:uncharacterized protein DUF6644